MWRSFFLAYSSRSVPLVGFLSSLSCSFPTEAGPRPRGDPIQSRKGTATYSACAAGGHRSWAAHWGWMDGAHGCGGGRGRGGGHLGRSAVPSHGLCLQGLPNPTGEPGSGSSRPISPFPLTPCPAETPLSPPHSAFHSPSARLGRPCCRLLSGASWSGMKENLQWLRTPHGARTRSPQHVQQMPGLRDLCPCCMHPPQWGWRRPSKEK